MELVWPAGKVGPLVVCGCRRRLLIGHLEGLGYRDLPPPPTPQQCPILAVPTALPKAWQAQAVSQRTCWQQGLQLCSGSSSPNCHSWARSHLWLQVGSKRSDLVQKANHLWLRLSPCPSLAASWWVSFTVWGDTSALGSLTVFLPCGQWVLLSRQSAVD